jgi:hypothetical protein
VNAPTQSIDDVQAACYMRLHARLVAPDALFDPTWNCGGVLSSDRMRWSYRLLQQEARREPDKPLFTRLIDRLALLQPRELQKVLCATALLRHQEKLRRCIDGSVVRKLQAMVGTEALEAVLRSRLVSKTKPGPSDLSINGLLAESYGTLVTIFAGQSDPVLHFIRIALPVDLAETALAWDRLEFEEFLLEAHACYPELKWLSG